jgi:hypothetical protein
MVDRAAGIHIAALGRQVMTANTTMDTEPTVTNTVANTTANTSTVAEVP